MGLTEYDTLDAVTVGSSELSILSGTTTLQADGTDGTYQLWVDAANMAKADEYRVRIYETVRASGTKRKVAEWTLEDNVVDLFVSPPLGLMHGWDMTLQKIAGTDRAFDASIRQA